MKNKRVNLSKLNEKIGCLNQRIDSLNRKLRRYNKKANNVISSHQYYIRKRFPSVRKRQNVAYKFACRMEKLLKTVERTKMFQIYKKRPMKNEHRCVFLVNNVELNRLRRWLKQDHRYDYYLQENLRRNRLLPKNNRRKILFLDNSEKVRLKYLLNK